jgi:hypothetical protein
MSPELEQRLYNAFSHLFREHLNPEMPLGKRGIECGDECFDLIWALSQQIAAYIEANPDFADSRVVQVKEKLGSLRYRIFPSNEAIGNLVLQASLRSEAIIQAACQNNKG